jgi:cytochrome P450
MTSMIGYRVQSAAASLIRKLPANSHALAQPPAGSGLKPVLGESGPPLVGNSFSVLHDTLGIAKELYAKYGPVYWTDAFANRVVMALGPDALDQILVNRDKAFSTSGWDQLLGPFFHRGVMLLDFEEHMQHRRILQMAFGRSQLTGYLDVVNPAIHTGIAKWQPTDQFPMYHHAKELLLDLAIRVFVGAKPGPELDEVSQAFVDCVAAAKAYIRTDIPGSQWRKGLHGRKVLERYFREQVAAKRTGAGQDMFTVMAQLQGEDGNRFTDDDVINHMIFVLLAAHDTSSIVLSQMTRFLGQHPGWQDRLREESIALGRDAIEYDDQDKLQSMDLVFKETARMYPPVGFAVRRTMKDTEIQGHYVPSGTIVAANVYPTHRMEPWWSNPDTFDPERFSDERREDKSHRMAWSPFGGGAHKCLGVYFAGMEIKAILHQMLLNYRWHVDPAYDPPISLGTGPFPADGLPLELAALEG